MKLEFCFFYLRLYASPQHIAAGELVWLIDVFCFENSIFVWVNTTVPPPNSEENEKSSINHEMVALTVRKMNRKYS